MGTRSPYPKNVSENICIIIENLGPNPTQLIWSAGEVVFPLGSGSQKSALGTPESRQATLSFNEKNQFKLETRVFDAWFEIGGVQVKRIVLLPNLKFGFGGQTFKVIGTQTGENKHGSPADANLTTDSANQKSDEQLPPENPLQSWYEVLFKKLQLKFSGSVAHDVQASRLPIKAFSKLITLKFETGPQYQEEFHLGFGPRSFGIDTQDFLLLDPETPKEGFDLAIGPRGEPIFKSKSPQVRVNNKVVVSDRLSNGDEISWGSSKIKVHISSVE